jgi:hypothetical protein
MRDLGGSIAVTQDRADFGRNLLVLAGRDDERPDPRTPGGDLPVVACRTVGGVA